MKKEADIKFSFVEANRLLILLDVLTKLGGLQYAEECIYFRAKMDKEFEKEPKLNEV